MATIQIRVLNGKNGTPMRNEKVAVYVKPEGYSGREDRIPQQEYWPDINGNVSLQVDSGAEVYVTPEWWDPCQPVDPSHVPFVPVAKIVEEGYAAPNNCGRGRTETKIVRGTLIIFARKPSLIEQINR
jgi:hypothetical protein